MLKTILSVTGKPGLFKLISSGKNMVIVESLIDKKRMPIYARDKVVSLGDIAMYTDNDEVPLREVLIAMKKKENGVKATIAPTSKPEELKAYLAEVLPDFDRERVYNTDIKKLINWYNLLIDSEIDFEKQEEEEKEAENVSEESAEDVKKEEKPKKAASKPKASAVKNDKAKPAKASTKAATTRPTKSMNRKAQ